MRSFFDSNPQLTHLGAGRSALRAHPLHERAQRWATMLIVAGAGMLGCGADAGNDQGAEDTDLGKAAEALTFCQGTSCDGLRPADTQCKFDMQDTGLGAQVFDASGRAIGGIGLFESKSCQTVWASSSFSVSGGPRSFRMCAVRRRATLNEPSCFDYTGSFGNDSPMKFANSGKTVFGRVTVDGLTTRTPDYLVP